MIFGECPYCGAPIALPVPPTMPVFGREQCEACGKTYWEWYSPVTPVAYTAEDFETYYEVDEATFTVRDRRER